ncbi:MAG: beta strand repeat-containing protein [Cyanobacteriota bacterium]
MAFIVGSDILNSTNDSYGRITGTSANDTVSYLSATAAVNVSLSLTGAQSTGGSGFDELISIENITGSKFNDTLQGNSGNNIIDGGLGSDTVSYSNAGAGVNISRLLACSQNTIGAGFDRLINLENVIGSSFADTLTGNAANNVIIGGSGNDRLIGTSGSDILDGSADSDIADYSGFKSVVNLGAFGVLNKGTLGTDTLINLETIIGSGAQCDTIDHSGIGSPATGTITDLTAGKVTVRGTSSPLPLTFTGSQFEHVIGSNFADKISGNGDNNSLSAGAGDDSLIASTGNDTLNGGAGNDTANYTDLGSVVTLGAFGVLSKGSLGTDSLIGIETIIGSGGQGDTIDHSGIGFPGTGTITDLTTGKVTVNGTTSPLPLSFCVSQFEHVIGSSFADSITGNAANNSLTGGAGNDTISAGDGYDTIAGGLGSDWITGGSGIYQFDYLSLSESLLTGFDIIIDYSLGEVINRPGAGQVINSSNGTASSLTASALSGLLNIFSFTGNSSAAFTVLNLSGTFIALNDATAGFNESTDSILYLPAYNINGINTVTIG